MISIPNRTLKLVKYIEEQLSDVYLSDEARFISRWIVEELYRVSPTDIALDITLGNDGGKDEKLHGIIERLLRNEPIQYILGKAYFFGRVFFVSPDVLIPRQETEELVSMIRDETKGMPCSVLDIGTGSGCIAITLSLELKEARVYACDISGKALSLAVKNRDNLSSTVDFFQLDILQEQLPEKEYDIIVSNPPYVRESEKALLHKNVLDYEPGQALFVPDDDPLLFYREIASQASRRLTDTGTLYFEINEALGADLMELLFSLHYAGIIQKDLNGKERIIRATKT